MKAEQRVNENARTQYREYEEPRIAKLSGILTVFCVMGLALAYLYQKKRKNAMPEPAAPVVNRTEEPQVEEAPLTDEELACYPSRIGNSNCAQRTARTVGAGDMLR